ncbi:hypothetical protein [Acidihalobacter prosperus]|uniref:Lipoprotein n=1 Tax=Acidihalobacter prosperus TaxID=160660 RepID=A0A1A6C277_9GAMM|nr:hypothetical protein [Acidihalobacter prosperus]OBS08654.1 hypothetical protein Thpro_022904 [Acidihalobacter prosperus]
MKTQAVWMIGLVVATATLAGCDVPVGYPGPVLYPVVPIYGGRPHEEDHGDGHDGPPPGRYAQPMGSAEGHGYYPPPLPARAYPDRYPPEHPDRRQAPPRDERRQRQSDRHQRQDRRQRDRHHRRDERKREDSPQQQD